MRAEPTGWPAVARGCARAGAAAGGGTCRWYAQMGAGVRRWPGVGRGVVSRVGVGGLRTKACNYFIFLYSLLMSPRTIPCLLVPEEQKLRKLFRGGGRLATKGALLHGLPRPLLGAQPSELCELCPCTPSLTH